MECFPLATAIPLKKWNLLEEWPDFEKLVVKHWNKEHVSEQDRLCWNRSEMAKYK